ncbi:MAG: saccharopine dehydrogenase NADP-binding domain-containing protein [Deltaproteobacteria bacterium]|nr:saccharopine dehydrogenase NADP-binding domain-containing protein [Deltaproteobacteria bacterium]
MANVLVAGGAGAVGRFAVRTLARHEAFDAVVLADIDAARAAEVAAEAGGKVRAVGLDAGDAAAVAAAAEGCAVVLNCAGPFYRFGRPVLEGAVRARADYVDVCDDVDATLDLLSMDPLVRDAGLCALIGMGNSPGVTNLLARFASDQLLDSVEAVDIYHAHGGEPFEGEGVVAHRLHGMQMEIPMFLDGELRHVRFFEPDGIALRERTGFHKVGRDVPVYPYPHPEQVTIPRHMKVRRVTNRGTVLPDQYFELTCEVARLGLARHDAVAVRGTPVTAHDFTVAWLLRRRDEILRETAFGSQRGCAKVVVRGLRRGLPRCYVFSMASQSQALGEGTGIPAAMGAILMRQGKVEGKGVQPPEACVNPVDFLALVPEVLGSAGAAGGGAFEGVIVEKVDEHGNVERVDIPM